MVNTSEMVDDEKRVEIVDKYAEKLMNSDYPMDQTRNIVIGGLKGYIRLLSLSRDVKNPKWKPLHMTAGWNARNRRIAKQRSKTSWYKGKAEVEPPPQSSIKVEVGSIHEEEDYQPEQGASTQETQAADQVSGSEVKEAGNIRKKKRGVSKGTITLGGLKKVEKTIRRKEKNKMRKKLGNMSIPEGRKEKRESGPLAPIRSVIE